MCFIMLLFILYPFLRFQTEMDIKMIQELSYSTRKCLSQNVKYKLTYFSYVLPLMQYSSDPVLDYSITESWNHANGLPIHLRFIASIIPFNLIGLNYLIFDTWHLVDVLYVPYQDMCSFHYHLWKKGEVVKFFRNSISNVKIKE